ncbi:MAG: DUF1819 family protein [Deltaproteobacteria bacterium]|nr:DUF1819 family protein [Deltaproteobacteria bacterium]
MRTEVASVANNRNGVLGRDLGLPSARISSKGALVFETHAVFRALADGVPEHQIRERCLSGALVTKSARLTRTRIWDAINWRFFSWQPADWIVADFERAAMESSRPSRTFVGLIYLHYARRDHLTFDFVTERLFGNWVAGRRAVRPQEVVPFAAERYGPDALGRFRESTRRKVAGNLLSALRDFGVLKGTARKRIEQPVLTSATALHICRLLYEEGLRGRLLTEAADWRLFLLQSTDVTRTLASLARAGLIRFEQAGRTVILELPQNGAH